MVNVLKQAAKDARGGMAQIGDNAFHNVKRSMQKVGTSYQGSRAYNASFSNAKTTYAREMMDAEVGRKAFVDIHQAIKYLKHYNKKHIERIEKRYEHNPKSLDKHLTRLAEKFSADIDKFVEALNTYVRSINDALLRANEDFGSDDKVLIVLLEQFAQLVKKHKVVIPTSTLEKIKKKIKKLEKESEKAAKKEVKIDKKNLKKDKKGHIGHIAKMSWHKVRKVIRTSEEKQVEGLRENMRTMQSEIQRGEAKLSFLAYFTHYLDNKEILNKAYEKICVDFLLMIEQADKYYMDMEEGISTFKSMFQGYAIVKKIENELVKLAKDHKNIRTVIEKNIESQKDEYYISKKTIKRMNSVIHYIEETSQENLSVDTTLTEHLLQPAA